MGLTRPGTGDPASAVTVDRDERKPTSGEGNPSDHAPLIITLAPAGSRQPAKRPVPD